MAMVVAALDIVVSLGLAKRELLANPGSIAAPFLLGFQLFAIVLVFGILIGLRVANRRRPPDYHKRYMTMAMLSVLGPAIKRLPLHFLPSHNVGITILITIGCVLACVIADAIGNRRLHPAFALGAGLVIGSIFVVAQLARTTVWVQTVRWILV
jgi:hypothetical protein